MKNIVGFKFLQKKKRMMLGLLSMLMIGYFSIATILSVPDITTDAILYYPSPNSGTENKACYYCHSLNNNHLDDDGGHENEDDDAYNEEDWENEYEREDA